MKWLYRIFSLLYGCRHKWRGIKAIKTYEFSGDSMPVGQYIIVQCVKCGKYSKQKC